MNNTAGSYALLDSVVDGESTVAAKLRAAGAILLGKTSLSEWANWRGTVPSGFCGRGGQGTNPYVPLGNPSGSSSGSGIAGAIGLATATLGSETDGSIIGPSSQCNLVGFKPTVGLTSRAGGERSRVCAMRWGLTVGVRWTGSDTHIGAPGQRWAYVPLSRGLCYRPRRDRGA